MGYQEGRGWGSEGRRGGGQRGGGVGVRGGGGFTLYPLRISRMCEVGGKFKFHEFLGRLAVEGRCARCVFKFCAFNLKSFYRGPYSPLFVYSAKRGIKPLEKKGARG